MKRVKSVTGLVFVGMLMVSVNLQATETIRLTAKDFGPHYDKYDSGDPFIKRGKYVQMRGHKQEHKSKYATAEFEVKKGGWYEVWFRRLSGYATAEVALDGEVLQYGKIVEGGTGYGPFHHFTIYLTAGKHSLRLSGWMALFSWVELRPAAEPRLKDALLASYTTGDMTFRKGEEIKFRVYGSPGEKVTFEVRHSGAYKEQTLVYSKQLTFTGKSKPPYREVIEYQCDTEGVFEALARGQEGYETFEKIEFCVVDTSAVPVPKVEDERPIRLRLVDEIDCAAPQSPHFYKGDDQCHIVETSFGKYRESGPGSHEEESKDHGEYKGRHSTIHKGYFGYRYGISKIGQPHIIEIDYPDDAPRSFLIVLGEFAVDHYLNGSLIVTGKKYPLSGKMVTTRYLVWPRIPSPSIYVMNYRKGSRAALSKIRVYAVDGGLPPMGAPEPGFNKRWAGWHLLEPRLQDAFFGLLTTAERLTPRRKDYMRSAYYATTRQAVYDAAGHYGEYARYMGMNTLTAPQLYSSGPDMMKTGRLPSQEEMLKIILLVCEKYGVDYIHKMEMFRVEPTPMEEELKDLPDPKPHLQVSRTGRYRGDKATSYHYPAYDPLHPARQLYVRQKLEMLLDTYKSYPALKGVFYDLASYTGNEEFVYRSIHWGYSDYDIDLFEKDTGIKVPVGENDPQKYQKRYDWLMANKREEWIDWRCRKVEEVINRTLEVIHRKRPGMKIHLLAHDVGDMLYVSWAAKELQKMMDTPGMFKQLLREKGLDVDRLSKNPYLVITYKPMADMQIMGSRKSCAIQSHVEYQDNDTPEEIDYKKNNGYYISRQLYPEKEGYALPMIMTGDQRHGDHYLARYARWMADGNVYGFKIGATLNPPNIEPEFRRFLRVYRSLPDGAWSAYGENDALEPVSFWSCQRNGRNYFYLVNRAPYTVTMSIAWETAGGALKDLVTERTLTVATGGKAGIEIAMDRYELKAFVHPGRWKLTSVEKQLPEDRRNEAAECLEEVEEILRVAEKEEGDSSVLSKAKDYFALAQEALARGAVSAALRYCDVLVLRTFYDRYGSPAILPDKRNTLIIDAQELQPIVTDEMAPEVTPSFKVLPRTCVFKGDVIWTSGQAISLGVKVDVPCRYIMGVRFANGANNYGALKLFLNNREIGTIGRTSATEVKPKTETLHTPLLFKKGMNILKFQRTGPGRIVVKAVNLSPVYTQIRSWYAIAPFPNPDLSKEEANDVFPGKAFYDDGMLPPEKKIDLTATYDGWNNQKASWKKLHVDADMVDLGEFYGWDMKEITMSPKRGPKLVGYVFTYMHSSVEQKVTFKVDRLDWHIKVFVNKELVYTKLGGHTDGYFTAKLKKGWNEFLVKPVQGTNSWTFNISMANPGDVRCTLEKE